MGETEISKLHDESVDQTTAELGHTQLDNTGSSASRAEKRKNKGGKK